MFRRLILGVLISGALLLAAITPEPAAAGGPCVVPRAWGAFKQVYYVSVVSVSYEALVFEDADGTIRALSASKCDPSKPIFEIVRR